jgi:uncharacterized damage-inducible protein DinB
MIKSLVQSWQANHNINLFMLDEIVPEALQTTAVERGRTVEQMLLHMADVRNKWLAAMAPELMKASSAKNGGDAKEKARIALEQSAAAVQKLIEQTGDPEGKVKGFKPNLMAFVFYLTAHDAHHRGQILLTLRLGGHRLDSKISYGMWDWAARYPK